MKGAAERVTKGDELGGKGEFKAAMEEYSVAINLNSHDKDPGFRRGVCHYPLKDYAKALADFDGLLKLETRHARGLAMKGECPYQLQQWSEAVTAFRKAFRRDESSRKGSGNTSRRPRRRQGTSSSTVSLCRAFPKTRALWERSNRRLHRFGGFHESPR